MTRSKNSASRVFGGPAAKLPEGLELVEADARDPRSLAAAFSFEGSERGRVAAVACCTGTTAFPSKRWQGDNGPKQTDEVGTRNLVEAAKSEGEALKRFVLVSSAGVLVRRDFFSIHVDFLGFFFGALLAGERENKHWNRDLSSVVRLRTSLSSPSNPAHE